MVPERECSTPTFIGFFSSNSRVKAGGIFSNSFLLGVLSCSSDVKKITSVTQSITMAGRKIFFCVSSFRAIS
jgi:hypothetical protein